MAREGEGYTNNKRKRWREKGRESGQSRIECREQAQHHE